MCRNTQMSEGQGPLVVRHAEQDQRATCPVKVEEPAYVASTEYFLIETLAERTSEVILTEFPVNRLKLRVSKPGALRGARTVGVVLRRTRSDYSQPVRAFLDLGTNVDRERSIQRGLMLFREHMEIIRVSNPYESQAYGPSGQPPFINLSVEVETTLTPERLRTRLREIETAAGRVRTADKFAPRTLDLDIILYGTRIERHEAWQIPHPQLETKRFVLEPLAELEPERIHPLSVLTLADMRAMMSAREDGP